MSLNPLAVNDLPKAWPFRKLLGPSFIILGLGLGSGEIILWPYLTSHFGLGIIWGAILGLTFQFFMNMEIERYTLSHGESTFVGLKRKLNLIPVWFLISTFLPWIWPGIAASSAALLGSVFELEDTKFLAIAILIIIGLILSLGAVLYKTVETLQKVLILIGVPSIFILAVILAEQNHWVSLAKGVIGLGDNYLFLPAGISFAVLLGALAYSGAGGNLNLAQSFYIREKGYGMGKYGGRITSLIRGKSEAVNLEGARFLNTTENLAEFKKWWRNINFEHFIIFWLTGSVTILLLALLSFATTYGSQFSSSDISFVFHEASVIGLKTLPVVGTFFLLIAGSTLFGTQLTVLDATSRILTENVILTAPHKFSATLIPKIYYLVLWAQIMAGIIILLVGFTQPLQLIITAAVLNAFAMFIHVGLTLWLNLTSLDKNLKPGNYRILAMILAFLFYGGFSIYTLANYLFKS